MPEIQQRLKDVVIESRDFAALIKTYNRPGTLFYCDPPYFNAEQFYQGFGAGDHERLKKALDSVKGRFVLSYNDTPEIRALYKDYNIIATERANDLASKKGAGQAAYKELIITNYDAGTSIDIR